MHIVYFDESGNTGNNLSDAQQPVFMLCALVVAEERWIQIEQDLYAETEKLFPSPRPSKFEIHAANLANGKGQFRSMSLADRVAFRDAWFSVAVKHELKIIYRAIVKKRYERWMQDTFGSGIVINPHVVAFPLVARVINDYLKSLPTSPLGIFIFDENKEIARDVEKSIKVLRGIEGTLKLTKSSRRGSSSTHPRACCFNSATLRTNVAENGGSQGGLPGFSNPPQRDSLAGNTNPSRR